MEPIRDIQRRAIASIPAAQQQDKQKQQPPLSELAWECKAGVDDIHKGCGIILPTRLPTKSGRLIRRMCQCEIDERNRQRAAVEEAERRAAIRVRTYTWLGQTRSMMALASKTFENFDENREQGDDTIRDAYEAAQIFITVKEMEGTLVLHGEWGMGKTHLLAAMCNALRTIKGKSSLFMTAPSFFEAIQDCIASDETYTHLIAQAISTPLLCIDDIDKAYHTQFREEIWWKLINERTNLGKPIVISTNRLADLKQFVGQACASRLSMKQIAIEMIGEDFRLSL